MIGELVCREEKFRHFLWVIRIQSKNCGNLIVRKKKCSALIRLPTNYYNN